MVAFARSCIRRFLTLAAALAALAISALMYTSYACADHTTRATEIQENGINPWIMGGTIAAIVVALVAFGAAVLVWEHRDSAAERSSAPDRPQD